MSMNASEEDSILSIFLRQLSAKPRATVARRYNAMIRELNYLHERKSEDLRLVRKYKWSDVRLRALFAVNSVYQEVLGPLQASIRGSVSGLGQDLPIIHGSQRFDVAHAARISATLTTFFSMINGLGFKREWLSKNTCGDLIFVIARHEREQARLQRGDE